MTAAEWSWVGGIASALVLGLFAAFWDKQKTIVAGVLGIVAASVGGLFALHFEIVANRTEESSQFEKVRVAQETAFNRVVPTLKNPIWSSVVQDIAAYDRENSKSDLELILHEPLRANVARNFAQARNGSIDIEDKNDVVVLTKRLMEKAQRSLHATSYVSPSEWWNATIAQEYEIALEEARKRLGGGQRIFILRSTADAVALRPTMERQLRAGLDIKFVCERDVRPDRRKDFIVIDSAVAGELTLDGDRRFRAAKFYTTQIRAEDFEKVFSSLAVGAKPWSAAASINCVPPD